MSTPNDIEVMIHYFGSQAVHPRIDAPAVQEAIKRFVEAGLLWQVSSAASNYAYEVTEGGKMYVEALCKVPLPKRRWTVGAM